MDSLLDAITEWLKDLLIGGITSNLSGMFDSVNGQVAGISVQIGQTPQGWNATIFSMIQTLSESVIVPIAGLILAFVMTLELIQLLVEKNNLHDVDTWMFFKWIFKTAAAILIVTNTWNIVMGVFDAAQSVGGTGFRRYHRRYLHRYFQCDPRYGNPPGGDGARPVARVVDAKRLCRHNHVGADDLHLYCHLRQND